MIIEDSNVVNLLFSYVLAVTIKVRYGNRFAGRYKYSFALFGFWGKRIKEKEFEIEFWFYSSIFSETKRILCNEIEKALDLIQSIKNQSKQSKLKQNMKNLFISLNISKFWCLKFSCIFSETKQNEFVKESSNLAWGGKTEMELISQALLIFNFICLIQRIEQVLWEAKLCCDYLVETLGDLWIEAIGFREFEFLRIPERARERERERFTSEKVKFEGYKLIVYAKRGREKGWLGFSYSVCIMGRIVDQTGPIICIFLEWRIIVYYFLFYLFIFWYKACQSSIIF